MKIAHILPYNAIFPLEMHNGRYEWVASLAQLQVQQGHDVTIYCNPISKLKGVAIKGVQTSSEDNNKNNTDTFLLALSSEHDIYHSHFDNLHYRLAHYTNKPIIFTQHWWPVKQTVELAQQFKPKNVWAVPPTYYMFQADKEYAIQSKGHIYHGIDLSLFQDNPSVQRGERLLFVGRISPEKNLEIAIRVAKKANLGLDIIGKIAKKNQEYWQTLEPLIDGVQIRYLGAKHSSELPKYYSSARALFFASDITESFGLVAIEAQACGLPVIMQRGGSRNELIREQVTGFLCTSDDDYIAAALASSDLQSHACIEFAQTFDITIMRQNYDDLYRELLVDQSS